MDIKLLSDSLMENIFLPKSLIEWPKWYILFWSIIIYLSCTLDVRYTTNVHDRYVIIDQNKIYHLGHSIKDLGKKIFSICQSESRLITKLLNNI